MAFLHGRNGTWNAMLSFLHTFRVKPLMIIIIMVL